MIDDVLNLSQCAAQGDRAAVDALLQRFLPDVRAFVRLRAGPLLRARESSSDIVQSVCREVLEHQDQFRYPSETAFRQWLFTTALRKIQHRREYYLALKRDVGVQVSPRGGDGESAPEDALAQRYREFSTPSQHLTVKEEMARVELAFDRLSEEQREVITLAHLVGLSRAEIAERMGRQEGAVRVLLFRSLARLAGILREPGVAG